MRGPAPTIRLRLTVLYGLLFLITGAVLLTIGYFRTSCMNRGWCHRPGRGGQRPPSESIARAMTAQGEW